MRRASDLSFLLVVLWLQACGGHGAFAIRSDPTALPSDAAPEARALLERLRSLAEVTSVEALTEPGQYLFRLEFEQPVDHQQPKGRRFRQRLVLLHRSSTAPMVLASTGYALPAKGEPSETEPAALLQGNQLLVEYRYYGGSIPQPLTWEHLTLTQMAADHHRVVEAFKPLYSGRWVSTGVSKGGTSMLVHRALYPGDVDATVAYVAPGYQGPSDARLATALETTVGDAGCRARLHSFQRAALSKREELVPLVAVLAARLGFTLHELGPDAALEFAVLELPFAFWAFWDDSLCARIPGPEAPLGELFAFLTRVTYQYAGLSDQGIAAYRTTYYQQLTEMGFPLIPEEHLRDLLRHPGLNTPDTFLRMDGVPPFDGAVMRRVEHWVRTEARRVLLVYGENDPWTAAAFEVDERNDSWRLIVPRGNHAASISQLPETLRALAQEWLTAWAGLD